MGKINIKFPGCPDLPQNDPKNPHFRENTPKSLEPPDCHAGPAQTPGGFQCRAAEPGIVHV